MSKKTVHRVCVHILQKGHKEWEKIYEHDFETSDAAEIATLILGDSSRFQDLLAAGTTIQTTKQKTTKGGK